MSVLGLLLFSINVNDILESSSLLSYLLLVDGRLVYSFKVTPYSYLTVEGFTNGN